MSLKLLLSPPPCLWIGCGYPVDDTINQRAITSQMPIACCLSVPNLIILPLLLSTSAANVVDRMPRALRLMSWSALFFTVGLTGTATLCFGQLGGLSLAYR
jgi:hypothetical protein